MIIGDFNAKVGEGQQTNWPNTVGRYGLGKPNERGLELLQFCAINDLAITNTLFSHSTKRRATWVSPDNKTLNQIDYIIIQEKWKSKLKNSRAYHSADISSDHFLLLANFVITHKKQKKIQKVPKRYDVDKLTGKDLAEKFCTQIGGAFAPLLQLETDDIEEIYTPFKETTNQITQETVGLKGRKRVAGLSPEVEIACERRRKARIEMLHNPADKVMAEQYKELNKVVKTAVKEQKAKNLQAQIEELEADFKSNNSHNLFKSVREMEGKSKKVYNAIRDRDGVMHTNTAEVLQCWKNHFEQHLNTEFPHDPDAMAEIPGGRWETNPQTEVTKEEIEKAIKRMKNRKAPGTDIITAEVLKAGGEHMVNMLHKIFNIVWRTERTPKDWGKMLVTPIHKKGDKQKPENYRAISLLSIPGKVFSRILLDRMKSKTEEATGESQFGFRPNRGTVDAIFIVRQIIEKAKEHHVPLHFNFIDFKAAFDTIWRRALWKMMTAIGVDPKIVRIIETLYDNTKCAVVIDGQLTEWFEVGVGLRQGCLLSPTLFNIFLEFVMKELKNLDESLKLTDSLSIDIRYADDTTLLSTIFEKLKISTEQLDAACKKWGMKINGAKCKILSPSSEIITLDGAEVEQVNDFVFLGSMVPNGSEDVKRRISLASTAFGRLRNAIWNKRAIGQRLKVRLYNALILPIAIYASETWTLKAEDERRLEVFEMRCLRRILGVSLRERRTNESIRKALGMPNSITEVIKRKRLKWFGHISRRPPNSYVSLALRQDFPNPRPRGRPPKKWTDQIRKDTGLPLATAERRAADREGWRRSSWQERARVRRS